MGIDAGHIKDDGHIDSFAFLGLLNNHPDYNGFDERSKIMADVSRELNNVLRIHPQITGNPKKLDILGKMIKNFGLLPIAGQQVSLANEIPLQTEITMSDFMTGQPSFSPDAKYAMEMLDATHKTNLEPINQVNAAIKNGKPMRQGKELSPGGALARYSALDMPSGNAPNHMKALQAIQKAISKNGDALSLIKGFLKTEPSVSALVEIPQKELESVYPAITAIYLVKRGLLSKPEFKKSFLNVQGNDNPAYTFSNQVRDLVRDDEVVSFVDQHVKKYPNSEFIDMIVLRRALDRYLKNVQRNSFS